MAVSRLDEDGVSTADLIYSMGQTQQANVLNEPGICELGFQPPHERRRSAGISLYCRPAAGPTVDWGPDVFRTPGLLADG